MEDPARNFPRGLAIVVPLAVISFFLPVAAALTAAGNWQKWQTGYMVTAARSLGGPWLQFAMFGAAAICAFILLDSTILSVTRIPFTMSEDGYLHHSLARLNARFGTPARAILLSVIASAVLAFWNLTQLIAIYAWLRAATSMLTLLSLWRLRLLAPGLKRQFVVPGGTVGMAAVVLIPISLFTWALINSDPSATKWGLAWLVVGPVAYLLLRTPNRLIRRRSEPGTEPQQ